MILNISGRTDVVHYYSDWLFKRFEEGFVLSRNTLFPNSVRRYELTPEKIDCITFCSKNYAPILPRIGEITDRFATYFHYTITAYGCDVEPHVPDIGTSIATLLRLSEKVGAKRVAWRYDPVLLTEHYTKELHLKTFEYMAARLAGHIDRCIFSFVEMYRKLERNFPELIPMTPEDKRELAAGLGRIAREYGFPIQTCGPEADYAPYGIAMSGCITLDIIGAANGLRFRKLKHQGMRQGCHCFASRDLGAMNSCPSGCKYCYANKNATSAWENHKRHDPSSPLLIGHVLPTDRVEQGVQETFLMRNSKERTLFDERNTERIEL